MEREQFTFYASFARAILRIRKAGERCAAYDAIVKYALYEEAPGTLPDAAAIVFDLVRPVLDTGREKARGGKKGKKAPRIGQGEADRDEEETGKRTERYGQDAGKENEGEEETEEETEKETEKETEYECSSTPAPPQTAMGFFLDRVNASPSAGAVAELKGYVERLGDAVVLHALGVALDERKTAWSYIRAILRRYEREGLRSVEAVQRSELERMRKRAARRSVVSAEAYAAQPGDPVDMEKLKHLMEEI